MAQRWLQKLAEGLGSALERAGESLILLAVLGALVQAICLLAFGCGKNSVLRQPIIVPKELRWSAHQ